MVNQWINVNDQLPEELVEVLVYSETSQQVFIAYYFFHEWVFPGNDYKNDNIPGDVTLWLPIPPLPSEDSNDA